MTKISHDQNGKTDLLNSVDKLSNECYNSLEQLCEAADKQADMLNSLESQDTTSQYTALCKKLIADVKVSLKKRHDAHIPYIKTLVEKVEKDHNCLQCSGTCNVNHQMALLELKASHNNVKNILHRLQMVSLPLYSETKYPDAYRILRNQMALIENSLTKLFFLEEHYLIPKVITAQNIINVGS